MKNIKKRSNNDKKSSLMGFMGVSPKPKKTVKKTTTTTTQQPPPPLKKIPKLPLYLQYQVNPDTLKVEYKTKAERKPHLSDEDKVRIGRINCKFLKRCDKVTYVDDKWRWNIVIGICKDKDRKPNIFRDIDKYSLFSECIYCNNNSEKELTIWEIVYNNRG